MRLIFSFLACLFLASMPVSAGGVKKCGTTDCPHWLSGDAGLPVGRAACYVGFYAPEGATKFEIQLFDEKGKGFLVDGKTGKVMPRGGEGTRFIGIGCGLVEQAAKLIACATIGGHDKTTILYANGRYLPVALRERRLTVPF